MVDDGILSASEFNAHVAEALGMSVDELADSSFDEIGFDSLLIFELDLVLEELGAFLPEEAFAEVEDMAGAYRAYLAALDQQKRS
jgi:acyl carrier protein